MKRIAIDSNIADNILDEPGLAGEIGEAAGGSRLIFITNHVVRDELARTPNVGRRERLLAVYDALPKRDVPTHGGVSGISKWGGFRWGDPSHLKTSGRGALRDALIGMTAAGEADVLVTEDDDLKAKVRERVPILEVWSFQGLVAFVRQVPPNP